MTSHSVNLRFPFPDRRAPAPFRQGSGNFSQNSSRDRFVGSRKINSVSQIAVRLLAPFVFVAAFVFVIFRAPNAFAKDSLGVEFFEKKIRPVLVQHCYSCHSVEASSKGKLQAGLFLDSKRGLAKGGESGPVVAAGDPEHSLLISALRYEAYQMPPNGKLAQEIIDDFALWVRAGAPDPRDDATTIVPRREAFQIRDADRRHWAFQPIRPMVPLSNEMRTWAQEERDVFILANLERLGLQPSPPADRYALIRRVTFAATGLPPTPQEIDGYVHENLPDAYDRVVDRLLASPEYGIHWGRHWLDGVRYTTEVDKSGAYRDWIIRSLNRDLPYDTFVRLQLAGDLIPAPEDDSGRNANGASFDGVTATGMLAMAIWEQVARDLAVAEIVDSQIDLVGRQLLGLTLACARCHDHKYDPISTEDYYALSGVFFSSHIATGKIIADGRLANEVIEVPLLGPADAAHNGKIDSAISQLDRRIQEISATIPQAVKLQAVRQQLSDAKLQLAKTNDAGRKALTDQVAKFQSEERQLLEDQQTAGWAESPAGLSEIAEMKQEISKLQKEKFVAPVVCGVREGGVPGSHREAIGDARVYLRGEYLREGPLVPRRFPTILAGDTQLALGLRTRQSGRLELAQWITSSDHPLTSRVMVNRIWQRLMGSGLVRSPDNFGRSADPPTHPELLDQLAYRFMEGAWSVKRSIRSHLLSATFRQGSFSDPDSNSKDPENLGFHRFDRRRLSYEELQDALLVAGDRVLSGAGPVATGARRRTMFHPLERRKVDATLAIFDGPDPKSIVVTRAETTSAPQALFLLNNPLVTEMARSLSERVDRELPDASDLERISYLWLVTLGHPPTPHELLAAQEFLGQASWSGLGQALLCTNEFAYLD